MRLPTFISLLLIVILFAFKADEGEKYVLVNGKKQYVRIWGTGKNTLVFISGLGVMHGDFDSLQKKTSALCRTLVYDKAGQGNSESLGTERSLVNQYNELKEVLNACGIKKNLILVGHSRGALLARYFAYKEKKMVKAMMLIDGSLPEIRAAKRNLRSAEDQKEYDAFYEENFGEKAETEDWIKDEFKCMVRQDSATMSQVRFIKKMPVVWLVSIQNSGGKYETKELNLKKERVEMYARENSNLQVKYTEKSGHFIYLDEESRVIEELTRLIGNLK